MNTGSSQRLISRISGRQRIGVCSFGNTACPIFFEVDRVGS